MKKGFLSLLLFLTFLPVAGVKILHNIANFAMMLSPQKVSNNIIHKSLSFHFMIFAALDLISCLSREPFWPRKGSKIEIGNFLRRGITGLWRQNTFFCNFSFLLLCIMPFCIHFEHFGCVFDIYRSLLTRLSAQS